jgi:hypothetical protein
MALGSMMGPPIWRKKRAREMKVGPKSRLPPTSQTVPAPPRSASTSTRFAAISSSASSQGIRFQRPAPRGPTRRRGWDTRDSLVKRSPQQAPFWQPRGLASGTVSLEAVYGAVCSSRQTMPSRT